MIGRSRRRVNSTLGRFTRTAGAVGRAFGHIWRRSLQLRVVVSTLVLSVVVLLILGFVLVTQITDRLLDVKLAAATDVLLLHHDALAALGARPTGRPR